MSNYMENHGKAVEIINQQVEEIERLRAVVVDMLAGLEYLRITKTVPYGFGIDRLEATGRAALLPKDGTP